MKSQTGWNLCGPLFEGFHALEELSCRLEIWVLGLVPAARPLHLIFGTFDSCERCLGVVAAAVRPASFLPTPPGRDDTLGHFARLRCEQRVVSKQLETSCGGGLT